MTPTNPTTPSLIQQAKEAAKPQLDQLKKATDGFEAIFMKSLLSEMQKGTTMFGTGPGADIYQDLMDQTLADSISKSGSLGISHLLYSQLAPRIIAQAEAKIKLRAESGQKGEKTS